MSFSSTCARRAENSPRLDYSDHEPVLYLGELVEFDDLKLKNLRSFEGWS